MHCTISKGSYTVAYIHRGFLPLYRHFSPRESYTARYCTNVLICTYGHWCIACQLPGNSVRQSGLAVPWMFHKCIIQAVFHNLVSIWPGSFRSLRVNNLKLSNARAKDRSPTIHCETFAASMYEHACLCVAVCVIMTRRDSEIIVQPSCGATAK